jgi:hypothetical protein
LWQASEGLDANVLDMDANHEAPPGGDEEVEGAEHKGSDDNQSEDDYSD